MRKVLCLIIGLIVLLAVPLSFAEDIPNPTNYFYANDFANILSDETEETIIEASAALAEKTGAQIVVVTVDTLNGDSIENYALNLFRTWGIGDADKNNGVLLLIAMNDRMTRIEVGYGLEGALNDAKTGRIQDNYLIKNLQEGKYDEGVLGTYYAIAEEVYHEYDLNADEVTSENIYYNPINADDSSNTTIGLIGKLIIGIIAFAIILLDFIFNRGRLTRMLIYAIGRSGRGGRGGGFGGFSGGGGRSGGGGSSRGF